MDTIFHPDKLTDPDLKNLYDLMLARGSEAVSSFRQHYNKTGPENHVEFRYVVSNHFNAEAERTDNGYQISFHSPTILLLRTLFDAIFFYPVVVPEIGGAVKDKEERKQTMPFILDVNLKLVADIHITTNPYRQTAASIFADFCSAFIVMHEVGHVICGHTDYQKSHQPGRSISELYSFADISPKNFSLLQAWEYDADAVSARLIVQFISSFANIVKTNAAYGKVFNLLAQDSLLLERLTALTIISLYAMFTYLAKAQKFLNRYSSHPHPLHRSSYIKDMILKAMGEREKIQEKKVRKFNQIYFDQFSDALEEIGLLPYPTLTSELASDISKQTALIANNAAKFRQVTKKFSWISMNEWS